MQTHRKADGEVAQTAAESRQAWRAHGEKLGQYDPSDPAYEAEFATEVEGLLHDVELHESRISDARLQLMLNELLPAHNADNQPDVSTDDRDEAEEIAHQIARELEKTQQRPQPDGTLDAPFSREELDAALEKTPNYKAMGRDGVKGEFLRYLGDEARDCLLAYYNLIYG